jgi:pulcherriminic acid synthase
VPVTADELYTREHRDDPHPLWERLRHEQPIFFDDVSGTWIVTRYHDVAEVFRDHETYANGPYERSTGEVFGRTILEMGGLEHVQQRSIVAPEFVGRRLDAFRPAITRAVDALIACFGDAQPLDLVASFTTWLPINVIVDMLGFDLTGREDVFHRWYSLMMDGLAPVDELRERGKAAHAEVCAFVDPLIAQRRGCPGHDLLTRLVEAEAGGRSLTDVEIESFVSLMLVAGGETTDKAIANLWWNLLREPAALAAVTADPSLLDAAFSETMRRDGPVLYEARDVTRDVEWYGVTVPAGAVMRACLGSANSDETVFADPRGFDLSREDLHRGLELRNGGPYPGDLAGHLGFGLGKHFCLGYELARAEAVLGSRRLLEALPGVRLADELPPLAMIRSFRAAKTLPVTYGR